MLAKMRKMLLLERLGKDSAASRLIWRRGETESRPEKRGQRQQTGSEVKKRRGRAGGEVKWWTL